MQSVITRSWTWQQQRSSQQQWLFSWRAVVPFFYFCCVSHLWPISVGPTIVYAEGDDVGDRFVSRLVATEKVNLQLQRNLNRLSQSGYNLKTPDWRTQVLFTDQVLIKKLAPQPQRSSSASSSLGLQHQVWATASPVKVSNVSLLEPLFKTLDYVEHFKLKLVTGDFADETGQTFVTEVSIHGLGRTFATNSQRSFSGQALVYWEWQTDSLDDANIKDPNTKDTKAEGSNSKHSDLETTKVKDTGSWRISRWLPGDLTIVDQATSPLFRDVLDAVLPTQRQRWLARRSLQEELVVQLAQKGTAKLPGPKFEHRFEFVSSGHHPGLAVVDIDGNGWDDLYVMSRWGKNQLYCNQGDGTFQELAEQYGLDIEGHCTSAIFADFDNDGDPDLFLGRSAFPSLYLINDNGRFHDRSDTLVAMDLPALVSSISAADYNRDGLLDIYFSTYGNQPSLVREVLAQEHLAEFARRVNSNQGRVYTNGVGAPNVLLVNRGQGKFALAPEAAQLEFWQTTFQATWADYDRDGDPDLYVANDFGPDRLIRNDHPHGFTDVTGPRGHPTMTGFGMGATWGDYDLDGLQDLYVSNMYSKAGMRITEKIGGLDPKFQSFANGNRLYRQTKRGFEFTSGLKAPQLLVAKAGWSWGGQFADFDNDGYPDIYVTSGYFTAPSAVAVNDDL